MVHDFFELKAGFSIYKLVFRSVITLFVTWWPLTLTFDQAHTFIFIVGVTFEMVFRSQWQKVTVLKLKTFKSYGVDEILGFEMEEKDGQTYVNFI